MRTRRLLAGLGLIAVLVGGAGAAHADAAAEVPVVNTNRLDVAHAFHAAVGQRIVRGGREADITTCDPGMVGADEELHTLRTVNFARRLVGDSAASFDPALTAKAAQAALVMAANGTLSHTIDSSWRCWTADAQDAAASSNLTFGSGPTAIQTFLDDGDDSNTPVGHRRWVLCPNRTVFGDGEAADAEALYVGDPAADGAAATPRWIAWPAAGYFPIDLEPSGRWSVGAAEGEQVDFSQAHVSVTGPGGKRLAVHVLPQSALTYCGQTLVWQLPALDTGLSGVHPAIGTGTRTYRVVVSGLVRDGADVTVQYPVRLFDGYRRQAVHRPALHGPARVGHVLTVSALVTSPKAGRTTYRWYRGSHPIAGVSGRTYRLRPGDAGSRITVRATAIGGRWYWDASFRVRSGVVRR